MKDLLTLKDAQIEALQRELEAKTAKLEEAKQILSELIKHLEVINPEILNNKN